MRDIAKECHKVYAPSNPHKPAKADQKPTVEAIYNMSEKRILP